MLILIIDMHSCTILLLPPAIQAKSLPQGVLLKMHDACD